MTDDRWRKTENRRIVNFDSYNFFVDIIHALRYIDNGFWKITEK